MRELPTAFDEPDSLKPEERTPCPVCGSTTRYLFAASSVQGAGALTAQTEVVTFPQRLMNIARSLIDDEGQFSFAVVVTHTACEIATERSLDEAFVANGISDRLQDWVKSLHYGYNLGNERIRTLYTALTGDEPQKEQAFWQKFKASVEGRNSIVHKGVIVDKEDADASYEAASELLARLNVHRR